MIAQLTILLAFQLAGEALEQGLGLIVPGPVVGLVLLLAAMSAAPRLAETVRPAAQGLLANLSLLFVPAGVGVVAQLDVLEADGAALIAAVVASSILAIVTGALAFRFVARAMGEETPEEETAAEEHP